MVINNYIWYNRRRNQLLLQDGGTVIVGGSNPTPSPTAPPSIQIAFSVSTILNGIIDNDVSTVPFDTDTTVRVYAEVESEDQVTEFWCIISWPYSRW